MSAFDRIEQRLPELMDELAPATVPDYFDDLLGQASRTRQRPAWASPERWLPMDIAARPATFRAPVLRPLYLLLLLGLLIAAGLVAFVGAQATRLPEPFGPARNGVIVHGTADGDIVALDPLTGEIAPLIAGASLDEAPVFTRDGTQFAFVRRETDNERGDIFLANADGSGVRELVPGGAEYLEWSPEGDRVILIRGGETEVFNIADGTSSVLDVGFEMHDPVWRPGHDQILFSMDLGAGNMRYYLVNADGNGLQEVEGVSPDAVNQARFSPDGTRLAYSSWTVGPGTQGRIHVLNLDTGKEVVLPTGRFETSELNPRFSPDGTLLVFERYSADPAYRDGYRLVVAPADGRPTGTPLGPVHPTFSEGAEVEFSPDGTQLLATYNADGSTWLLDVDGTGERRLETTSGTGHSWQRLAP